MPSPPTSTSISKFISEQPYLSMLDKQCTTMRDLHKIHAQLIKTGLVKDPIAASRVLAFSASPAGDINYAYLVFTQIQNPNLFIWNTIIRGFSQSSIPQVAISLFIDMLVTSSVEPQRLTYPSVFKAYAHLARLVFDHEDMEFDLVAWNSMIMGLAKCGEIDQSRKLFDKMVSRNTISWNSMISGYVRNGNFKEALELFGEMQEQNIRPSEFTMVSLLNACARLGAIRQGEWLHAFLSKNNFDLNSIVVTAIIDMYCKCGCPAKALRMFEKHGNVDLAKRAAKHIMELDKNESCSYVLMSNLYAASHRFEEAMEERLLMKEKRIEKEPGCSLIEVNGEVHEFVAGGRLHPKTGEIYYLLNELGLQ
ncbi:hypothetical protein Q3G72_028799 [Acer saccharum]|nr:hypothetical protein Q3G72_028799 [Acer saccharum]